MIQTPSSGLEKYEKLRGTKAQKDVFFKKLHGNQRKSTNDIGRFITHEVFFTKTGQIIPKGD